MNLKCMRASCKRTLAVVDGITGGEITLICPKCTGRSVYVFRPESLLQPERRFYERARDGESQSQLTRQDVRSACDPRETVSPSSAGNKACAPRVNRGIITHTPR